MPGKRIRRKAVALGAIIVDVVTDARLLERGKQAGRVRSDTRMRARDASRLEGVDLAWQAEEPQCAGVPRRWLGCDRRGRLAALSARAPPAAVPPSVVIQVQAPQGQAAPMAAGQSGDPSALRRLQAGETRNLNEDANALDNIAQQIDASDPPPRPAAPGR